MTWAGDVARMGGEYKCIQDLGGKAKRTETKKSPRSRWENNIKIAFREIEWGGMDWIHLLRTVACSCKRGSVISVSMKWKILG
jgi:hypothetical protein